MQIAKLDLEVVAIALLGEVQRDLVGDELSMPLAPSFSASLRSAATATVEPRSRIPRQADSPIPGKARVRLPRVVPLQ